MSVGAVQEIVTMPDAEMAGRRDSPKSARQRSRLLPPAVSGMSMSGMIVWLDRPTEISLATAVATMSKSEFGATFGVAIPIDWRIALIVRMMSSWTSFGLLVVNV